MNTVIHSALQLLRKTELVSFHATQARLYLTALKEQHLSEKEYFDEVEFYCAKLVSRLNHGASSNECTDLLQRVYRHAKGNMNFHSIFSGALSFLLRDQAFNSNKELCDHVFLLLAQGGFNNLHNAKDLLIHKILTSNANLSDSVQEYYLDKGVPIIEAMSSSPYLSNAIARRLDKAFSHSLQVEKTDDAINWANNPLSSNEFFSEMVGTICKSPILREMLLPHIILNEHLNDERIEIINNIVGDYESSDFELGVMSQSMRKNISRKGIEQLLPRNYYLTSFVDSNEVLSILFQSRIPPYEILNQYNGRHATGFQSRFTLSDRIKIMSFLNFSSTNETFEQIQKSPFTVPNDLMPNNDIISIILSLTEGKDKFEDICGKFFISEFEGVELIHNYIAFLAKHNYKVNHNITPPLQAYSNDSAICGFDFEKTAKFLTAKLDLDLSKKYLGNPTKILSTLDVLEWYSEEKEYLLACHIGNLSDKLPSNTLGKHTKRKIL